MSLVIHRESAESEELHGEFASSQTSQISVEGQGAEARENRRREGYGRREEGGPEAGFPRRRKTGENYEKIRNIA